MHEHKHARLEVGGGGAQTHLEFRANAKSWGRSTGKTWVSSFPIAIAHRCMGLEGMAECGEGWGKEW